MTLRLFSAVALAAVLAAFALSAYSIVRQHKDAAREATALCRAASNNRTIMRQVLRHSEQLSLAQPGLSQQRRQLVRSYWTGLLALVPPLDCPLG